MVLEVRNACTEYHSILAHAEVPVVPPHSTRGRRDG
jgi:hypothetical protein